MTKPSKLLSIVIPTVVKNATMSAIYSHGLFSNDLIETVIIENKTLETSIRAIAENRNTGAKKAKGEWLWFMDSDDTIYLSYSLLVSKLKNKVFKADLVLVPSDKTIIPPVEQLLPALLEGAGLPAGSILIKREKFLALNGFDPELPHSEVWEFLVRYLTTKELTVEVLANLPQPIWHKQESKHSFSRQFDYNEVINFRKSFTP